MISEMEFSVKYGTITYIENNSFIIVKGKEANGANFNESLNAADFDDFSDLYEGEEVAILTYKCDFYNTTVTIIGVVDKKQYDGAIRDSQKLPKGWLHEPYIGFATIQGKLELEDTNGYFPEAHVWTNDLDEYVFDIFDGLKVDNSLNADNGDDVVVTGYGIVYPNNKPHLEDIAIYKKDEYYSKYEASAKEYYNNEYNKSKSK